MCKKPIKVAILLSMMSVSVGAQAAWVGIVGYENARTVKPTEKSDKQQVETILQGGNLDMFGMTWNNTLAAKWKPSGELSVVRNWAYGFWDDHHGMSIDLIKADWAGQGPVITSLGYAYQNTWDNFSIRVNPTIARLENKLANNRTVTDIGAQLNVKMDYQVNTRLSLGFHPQFAYWQSQDMGNTLKLEMNATYNLTENKRHKLMLVHERFLVNNRGTGNRTRFVGEDSPLGGYVAGTESTIKLRYAYVF